MSMFEEYAEYYDLLYRDKEYAAEADYIAALIHRFAPEAADLLEFGSGTGIHGRLLAQKGFRVTGIERSRQMVSRARGALPAQLVSAPASGTFDCVIGDIRSTQLQRTFDAVISLFHVISYQTSNADVQSAFRNANHHLSAGGLFVFDVWYTPAVLSQRPTDRVKQVEDDHLRLTRHAIPLIHVNESAVDIRYDLVAENKTSGQVTDVHETHRMRYFSLPELELLAEHAGFALVHSEEFLTGLTPSDTTWGVCCVLKKVL